MTGDAPDPSLPHVVIVGGGFGGLSAARALGGARCRVTLVDRQNYHLFVPLLYQVATAVIAPGDIARPLRSVLSRHRNVDVVLGEVTGIDAAAKCVRIGETSIAYDVLVLATGSGQSYFGHGEWAAHAPGLKSVEDAEEIRNRLLMALEEADRTDDEDRRRALMTVVLIGGGPTGVELAGSISELFRHTVRHEFRHIRPEHARIVLIEAMPRLLGPFPERLARHAEAVLRGRGVELRFESPVEDLGPGRVVAGGDTIRAATIIWTAGVSASPAARWLGVEPDRQGRVPVDDRMAVVGMRDVYAIGDTALAKDGSGAPLPGLAQVAKQQGIWLGRALRARFDGKGEPEPFRFKNRGNMATIGRNQAVADIGGWRTGGPVAWILWSIVHVFLLIGFRNRMLVMVQWAWTYLTYQRGSRLILGRRNRLALTIADVAEPGAVPDAAPARPPRPGGDSRALRPRAAARP